MADHGRKRILLAEDEEPIAKLVAFKLAKEGFDVQITRNGQEALDCLEREPWALVILDVTMPVKDGWAVLGEIRARQSTRDLPVLILSAKNQRGDIAHATELGASRFLKKPFDPAELANVVKGLTA